MSKEIGKSKKGSLIVFEGIDGSGKSTQAQRIFKRLKGFELPVSIFKEPTYSEYGQIIRKLLSGEIPRQTPAEELDLFIKDRKEDVYKNILPALARGEIILLDRYYYSTIAYQGAMGIDTELIRQLNESFAPIPGLVLIFLIIAEKGLARIRTERAKGEDNYEKEGFLRKVDNIFRSLKDKQIKYIDSDRPLEEVNLNVDHVIDLFLKEEGWKIMSYPHLKQ